MSALVGRVRERLLDGFLPSRDGGPADSFEDYCEARFERYARVLLLGIGVGAIAWWPTDLVVLRRLPAALGPYARWRLTVAALSVAYVAATRSALVARHRRLFFTVVMAIGCALVAYDQAPLGGPETPWFHLLYTMPFVSILLPLPLGSRAAFTASLSAACLGGYLLPFPPHRASPFVPWMVSFFAATTTLSVAFGHALFAAVRDNFHQARALRASNDSLAERVRERTAELQGILDHVESARDAERRRLARDLHDDLGQELVGLRYAVAHCQGRHARGAAALGPELAEVRALVDQASGTMRALLNDLRPVVLDELGLAAASDWLLRRTERRTGIECRLRVEGDGLDALGPRLASEAYRIVQESLTNVVRHAGAQRVEVRLTATPEALELCVTDDGAGLGPPREGRDRGFGLLGMRERASALGGTFSAQTRPEGGTEVRCRLPRPTVRPEAAGTEAAR